MCPAERTTIQDRVTVRPAGNGEWVVALRGRWALERPAPDVASLLPAEWDAVERLRFQDADLDSWDSTLISVLVGLILAFVGSVQLATFGAQVTVADAVGIGMLRQMGALMTAILMAGLKLRLVGLRGYGDYYPFEISGGMRKRAALARAIALDPEILYLDEPSAGLDPVSAHLLDQLVIELRDSLGATLVVVTHELASIFAIADDAIFLDAGARTTLAQGPPRQLLEECNHPNVIEFLTRGEGRPTGDARR